MAFALAAALSALWLGVHLFLGGREIARPLLDAPDLPPVVRETQYLCWHFTSVSIAAIALFFGLAAMNGDPVFALTGTLLAAGFTLTGVGITTLRRVPHGKTPQGWLFLPVALLGLWGMLA